jgi:hypothetical protein
MRFTCRSHADVHREIVIKRMYSTFRVQPQQEPRPLAQDQHAANMEGQAAAEEPQAVAPEAESGHNGSGQVQNKEQDAIASTSPPAAEPAAALPAEAAAAPPPAAAVADQGTTPAQAPAPADAPPPAQSPKISATPAAPAPVAVPEPAAVPAAAADDAEQEQDLLSYGDGDQEEADVEEHAVHSAAAAPTPKAAADSSSKPATDKKRSRQQGSAQDGDKPSSDKKQRQERVSTPAAQPAADKADAAAEAAPASGAGQGGAASAEPEGRKRKHERITFKPSGSGSLKERLERRESARSAHTPVRDAEAPAAEPPVKQAKTDAAPAEAAAAGDEAPAAAAAAEGDTAAGLVKTGVLIRGLKRPLNDRSARQHLSQFGSIKDLWMPGVKTHCVLVYESEEQAEACCKAMQGAAWPVPECKLETKQLLLKEAQEQIAVGRGERKPVLAAAAASAAAAAAARAPTTLAADRLRSGSGPLASPAAGATPASAAAPGRRSIMDRLGSKSGTGKDSGSGAAQEEGAPVAERVSNEGSEGKQEAAGADEAGAGAAAAAAGEPAAPAAEEPPVLSLEDLFKKTTTKPFIYWLPLTEEQVCSALSQQHAGSGAVAARKCRSSTVFCCCHTAVRSNVCVRLQDPGHAADACLTLLPAD